ncbi:anti-sigma factor [Dactylosporangium sp. AC04546]|uniref:anti-sigma factor n=1 Tax=Dactylosporangium sp. AC04546 TaxID=2862460 RepID=UPI001EDFB471|nr:anti-sigma factor [Dactylosporangium sp. AC04546]WVK85144.1 anti-sigma factor [Dactylosporangium sp. AC04546]
MSHLEPERLVLLALGEETLDQHETGHLDSCERCRADMASLRGVAGLGRRTQPLRDLPPAPEHVWHRIRAELATSDRAFPPPAVSLHSDPPPRRLPPLPPPVKVVDTPARPGRRGPGWVATVVIAAGAAVAGAGVTAGVLYDRGGAARPAPAACRAGDPRVELEAVPGAPSGLTGYACLVSAGGDRKLLVHAEGMPARADGDYEAWLLDPAGLGVQPLGVLGSGADQELTVPGTLDLARFNVVDISAEPHDGNAGHSGHSLLRGRLP